jgi:hypothetical protein
MFFPYSPFILINFQEVPVPSEPDRRLAYGIMVIGGIGTVTGNDGASSPIKNQLSFPPIDLFED